MPEAIATTKRKFYKALDALTNASQSSLPRDSFETQTRSTTSSAKRSSAAAFDEARERIRKRLRPSNGSSSGSLVTLGESPSVISLPPRPTSRGSSQTRGQPPSNYSPWSQDTFLARLKTFSSVSQWHPKPDAVNEVQWAKRGWACVDVNTVACKGGCERRVVVTLDSSRWKEKNMAVGEGDEEPQEPQEEEDDDAELEEALAERYRTVIVDGHASTCLWRRAGCKDDIYRLSVVRPSVWQPQLRKRIRTLLEINSSVERVKIRPMKSTHERIIEELPADVLGLTPDESSTHAAKAFEIAMHGWRGSFESGTQLLHCDACFQRVGLWMYQPEYQASRVVYQDDGIGEDQDETAVIDLVNMHREHCPWRNVKSQDATGSLSGLNACQILHRVVSTAARDHRRRFNQQAAIPGAQVNDTEDEEPELPPILSREEVARQDKERESRLRKLKNLFNIKRRPTTKVSLRKAA